jgi:hypothetical protein
VTRRSSPKTPDEALENEPRPGSPFEIARALAAADDTGSVRLGPFERLYESLFADALEGGEISAEERERLDLAAAALRLDASRVARLEAALLQAWESEAAQMLVDPRSQVHVNPDAIADRAAAASSAARPMPDDADAPTLSRPSQNAAGAGRAKAAAEIPSHELHARYEAATRQGLRDDPFRIAEVLVVRGAATAEERAYWEAHRQPGPIQPVRPLTAEAWSLLLTHPDQDRRASEIFGVIASASLVGRVSAMRRDGTLPRIDPQSHENPLTSPVAPVRAIAWSAATLGVCTPPMYVAPELDTGFEILTMVPPSTRIGARALTGLGAAQLAFACGRHLSWYREEHFICTLVPSVAYLETIFYAALLLGAPTLPLPEDVRERAHVFAQAIVPCLEPPTSERLGRLVAGFLAQGGRTNLKRWARAAEWTACRAGLLLCGELQTAVDAVAGEPGGEARITQLETFWAGKDAGTLRMQLGVSVT